MDREIDSEEDEATYDVPRVKRVIFAYTEAVNERHPPDTTHTNADSLTEEQVDELQPDIAELEAQEDRVEDVDQDGDVDSADVLAVAMNFGRRPTGSRARYDVNKDNVINVADFTQVLTASDNTVSSSNAPLAVHPGHIEVLHISALHTADMDIQRLERRLREPAPKRTVLLANYPNPFNPETWLPYRLAKPADVTLTIYATNGQVVRTLALGHQPTGNYLNRARAAHWDGKNAFGEPITSGVYFYTLTADDFSATRKMLVVK